MKLRRHVFTLLAVLVLALLCTFSALAEEESTNLRFPEGTIEVPQGTEIHIDDTNSVVTIVDNPVNITSGDTFVVYLQDLPIAYVAKSTTVQGNDTRIQVEKADKAVYAMLDECGVIELTSDMYEFVPASNVIARSSTIGGDGLSYSDGKLSMKVALGGSYTEVYLSGLSLSHSISNGDISIVLNGNWGIESQLKVSEDLLSDVPLGEIRIYGVGKIGIKLSLDQSMSLKTNLSGTFSAGVTASQDGSGQAIKRFSVSNKSIEGKGSITAALKITAGIDILVAEADVYVEVGVKTQYTSQYHFDPVTDESIHCDDFKIYIFSTVGAEAKYFSIVSGKMKPLASTDVDLIDDSSSPFIVNIHFENGALVASCTQGMQVADLHYGGLTTSFGSTILTDSRLRVLETSVDLPWDMTVDGDYRIANGELNLNGHTLTITGDLIQSGGTLTIGSGTLIVQGDYRLQGEAEIGNGAYTDSKGTLRMNAAKGSIDLGGDFILQTTSTSHSLTAGTFTIRGDIEQITPAQGASSFKSGTGCNFVLESSKGHTILSFDDAENNSIGWISMNNPATSQGDISLGKVDMNGHNLIVNGTFTSTNRIDLQDLDPEPDVFTNDGDLTLDGDTTIVSDIRYRGMNLNGHSLTVIGDMISTSDIDLNGGTLTVTGTLYQQGGVVTINGGTLNVAGSYYIAGSGSSFIEGHESYTTTGAYLKMQNDTDAVHVGENFVVASVNSSTLTAGTLYIGGNFRQVSGSGSAFSASGTHKVVFNGSGTQSIQFDNYGSGFNVVRFENPNIELKGNDLRGFTLENDLNLTLSTDTLNLNGTMDLNGHDLGSNVIIGNFTLKGGNLNLNGVSLTINGNLTSSCNIDLNGYDLTVNGDLTSTSDIDLKGGTLTVTGTLYQQYGDMTIGGGTLNVAGSYYIAGSGSSFIEGHESYIITSAILKMKNDTDAVHVGENFVFASSTYYGREHISAGTLYIGGNFRQVKGNYDSFSAYGTHRVIFNGSGTQSIQFDSNSSGFNVVRFENPNIELKGNYLRGFTLEDDLNLTLSTDILNLNGTMDLNGHDLGSNTIDGDFTLKGGNLNLNGVNLTINGNLTSSCNIDLNGYDLTVNGDLTSTSDIDLKGGTLTVTGTLYQQYDGMTIGGGTLNVAGSYYIVGSGSSFIEGRESYVTTYAYLKMQNDTDSVHVGENFIVSTNTSSHLTAGTLYIGGNFRQVKGNYDSFSAYGTHRVIFNGSGTQSIQFDSNSSGFNVVRFENPNIELKGNYLRGFTLEDDLNLTLSTDVLNLSGTMDLNGHDLGSNTIDGDFTLKGGNLNLNGVSLTVNGNLTSTSNIVLNGAMLTVTETLYQQYGSVTINCGRLNVAGNYYIAGSGSSFIEGRESYVITSAYLEMRNDTDEVHVGGNFVLASNNSSTLTAGTLYVGGNFRQVNNGSTFNARGTHKVVFNGSGTQSIQFDSNSSGFNVVRFENPDIELKGNYLRGFTLEDDLNLTLSTDVLNLSGTMDLNGHDLGSNTIEGNFTLKGGKLNLNGVSLTVNGNLTSSCNIDLNGYDLTVNGNLTSTSDINLNGGTLTVNGTLYQQVGTVTVNGGTLNVAGSYYIAGSGSSFIEGREAYAVTFAYLTMQNDTDSVHVGENFVLASSGSYNYFTAGTLYIGGNFRQVSGYYGSFNASGTHKVVFNGTGTQSIQFDSNSSGFNVVRFGNPNIELKGNYLRGFTLEDDLNLTLSTDVLNLNGTMNLNCHDLGSNTIEGNFTLKGGNLNVNGVSLTVNGNLTSSCNIDLNGYDLTVNGDLTSEANIDLNGGYLTVTGTLYQENGTMHINGGKLNVSGNYYMAGADSIYVTGREVYFPAYSSLIMECSEDEVLVGNDFVIASCSNSNRFSDGVMYVSGDFTQSGSSNSFVASNSHKVVLSGSASQTVQFDNSNSTFNVLQLEMPLERYDFSTKPCWNTLIQPEVTVLCLPTALRMIEDEAFMNNESLMILELRGENLIAIGSGAFKGCSNLQQITIPVSVKSIADDAFDGCDNLLIVCKDGSYVQQYADAHDITWKEY